MKKLFKIFSYFLIVVFSLIIVLLIIAKVFENKISDIALKKISETIEAPVIIDDVSLNLLRKFPLATIELKNVLLGSSKTQNYSDTIPTDTIININKIYISVKSRPLISGIIEIMKVDIDGAKIYYSVDSSGVSNIDFLMDSTETDVADTLPSEPLNISLTDLSVKNIVCNYKDSSLKAAAKIIIPKLKIKGTIKGENILASVKGNMDITNCDFEETNLYLMNKTSLHFNIDYENDSLNIKKLFINTDGAEFNALGNVFLGDSIKTDIKFEGSELILNELTKYAPKEMLKEFGLKKLSGELNMSGTAKGIVYESELPQIDLSIELQNGNIVTADYPELKNISFSGKLTNGILRNNQSSQVDFSSLHFETKQSKFNIAFSVIDIDNPKYDITTDMEINIADFSDFIPDSLIQNINGNVKAKLSTKGELPDSIDDNFVDYIMANTQTNISLANLNIVVDSSLSIKNLSSKFSYNANNFNVRNLNIVIPAYNLTLKNTSLNADFDGSINNTSEMSLNLKSYHIETKQSEINGNAQIKNLDNPNYKLASNIKLNLDEVKTMLPDTLLTNLSGIVFADIKSSGTLNLDSITNQAMDIAFNSSSFDVNFKNVSIEMPDDTLYKIENLTGLFNMNPEEITINKMRGTAGGIKFEIDSTEIWNVYEVIIQENNNENIIVQTNLILEEISNSLIASFMPTDTINDMANIDNENSDSLINISTDLLPNFKEIGIPHFLVRGKLAVSSIKYKKNIINDISLKFRFADSLYVIDQLKLKTCGGQMNISAKLDARNWEKPVVDLKTIVSTLDIKKLLKLNDNFGDTTITYEKFSGILTSELKTRAFYTNGEWPTNKIRVLGHFTIENGSIYNYEPLVDLSKNKLIGGLKELDKLDFNTVNSSIFMFKDKIYIPKTDIVNSSMDITAFAMHNLKGDYEYHLQLHLGDVLTGKSDNLMKKQAKQNKIDGETAERNGINLVSLKKGHSKKNGFDNKDLVKKFKNKLNMQQGFLKLLFNPLLVNFSTDFDRTARNKKILEKYNKH